MREQKYLGEGLAQALRILPGITALVGSGGKTTLMLRLARELCAHQKTVIVCTSTRIYTPEGFPLVTGGEDELVAALGVHRAVCAAMPAEQGKLCAPRLSWETLCRVADYVLVEADGSRTLPLKAHAAHEPAIPKGARVIALAGASGFGQSVEQSVHRPELFVAAMGVSRNAPVMPELYARAVKEHFPNGTVLINQVDNASRLSLAKRFAMEYGAGTVVAAALTDDEPVRAIWRE